MSYFITPSVSKINQALEAWQWIGLEGKQPILVTAFADVFFSSSDGIWFLDTLEGKLKRISGTRIELEAVLSGEEGRDFYLFPAFVDRAIQDGNALKETQCYDFKLNPVVGGAVEYSNIWACDFVVALHIRGQLHEKVRHLPLGTKISKFVMVEEKPTKPWWRLW